MPVGAWWQSQSIHFPRPAETPDPPTRILAPPPQHHWEAALGNFDVSLATCNVLTMKSSSAGQEQQMGLAGPARMASILQQFADLKTHLVACQETRLRRTTELLDPSFILIHSEATPQGHGGLLLALNKVEPYGYLADGTACCFRPEDYEVICLTPRLMMVRLSTPLLRCIVIVAHAPHTGAPLSEISQFWSSVSEAIPRHYGSWPKLLLADTNACVGLEPNDFVGPWQAEPSHESAQFFLQFIQEQRIYLPATFEHCHLGPSGTWYHPSGRWKRIDYIGVSDDFPATACSSCVLDDIDVSLSKEDHRAVCLRLQGQASQPGFRWCHRRALQIDQLDWHRFASVVNHRLPFQMDVHQHAQQLQSHLEKSFRRSKVGTTQPLKQTITAETWQLIQEKRQCRALLSDYNKIQRATKLTRALHRWRGDWDETQNVAADRLLRDQDQQIASQRLLFCKLGQQVIKALRADDRRFFDGILASYAEFPSPQVGRHFWARIQRAFPKLKEKRRHPRPSRLAHLEDQWSPHFRQLEAGALVQPAALEEACRARQAQLPIFPTCALAELPSILDLEDVLRTTSPHKATGFDLVPSILAHVAPCQMADLYRDLVLKIFMFCREPMMFKGGSLVAIPKKLSFQTASLFRGILLLPTVAKKVHALARKSVIDLLRYQKPAGQLGGFPGQEVVCASHALQTQLRIFHDRGYSCCTVFVDLASAFHHLVRELVVSPEIDPHILDALQDHSSGVSALREQLEHPGLLKRLGASDRLIHLLRDVHCDTWYRLQPVPGELVCTHRGTRPGSPLADSIFHVLMADIGRELEAWLQTDTRYTALLRDLGLDPLVIIWSDDLAVPLAASEPQMLLDTMTLLIRKLHQLFDSRGFTLNYAKGKTSAVVSLRGRGAPDLRRDLEASGGYLRAQAEDGTPIALPLLHTYKHLGAIVAADGTLDRELATRIGVAAQTFNQLSKPLLCNRRLPLRTRVHLYKMLVETKLYYGAGAWITPTTKQLRRLHGVTLGFLHRLLRHPQEHRERFPARSAADLFHSAGIAPPRIRIAMERLLYAQRMFHHGPACLHFLLHTEDGISSDSWITGLKADLQWFDEVLPQHLPDSWQTDLTQLIDQWQQGHLPWKAWIKRAGQRHSLQELMADEARTIHKKIFHDLQEGGALFEPQPFADGHCGDLDYRCECGKMFTTPQGLATHRRKVHQVYSLEHHLLGGVTCPACLTFCWSTQRLQQHLSYVSKKTGQNACFQQLAAQGYYADYELHKMPTSHHGALRVDAVKVAGPLPAPLAPYQQEQNSLATQIATLQEQLGEALCPDGAPSELDLWAALTTVTATWFASFQEARGDQTELSELPDLWLDSLSHYPLPWHDWLEDVFVRWGQSGLPDLCDTFIDGEAEVLAERAFADLVQDLPRAQLRVQLERLLARQRHLAGDAAFRLYPHRAPRGPPLYARGRLQHTVHRGFADYPSWLDPIGQTQWAQLPPAQPVPWLMLDGRPTFVVCHLFSGRRRDHDFHHWLQAWSADQPFAILVLSLDTAVDWEKGDLSRGASTWSTLEKCYAARAIAATLCGPPCETFTEARFQPAPEGYEGRRWPRPLRSAQRILGLEGLSMREMRQAKQGSAFALQMGEMLSWHLLYGGAYVEEHPAQPMDDSRPSIWTCAMNRCFRRHPDIKLHHHSQWRYGAKSAKPTGLLTYQLPWFSSSMWQRRKLDAVYPEQVSIGVDSNGTFKTTTLKEYPEHFSKALAGAIFDQLQHWYRVGLPAATTLEPTLHSWVCKVARASSEVLQDSRMRADYQGQ
eukprot:Skav222256  [mRNA]  locus=scaffold3059:353379:358742:+ [translate_table: standard]